MELFGGFSKFGTFSKDFYKEYVFQVRYVMAISQLHNVVLIFQGGLSSNLLLINVSFFHFFSKEILWLYGEN